MITDELLEYIKEERKDGVSDDDIKQTLKDEGGWTDDDIAEAYDELADDKTENTASSTSSTSEASGDSQAKKQSKSKPKQSQKSSSNTKKQNTAKQSKSESSSNAASTAKKEGASSSAKKSTASSKQKNQATKQRQKAAQSDGSAGKVIGIVVAVLVIGAAGLGAAYVYMGNALPFGLGGTDHTRMAKAAIANVADNEEGLDRSSVVSTRESGESNQSSRIVSTAVTATDTSAYALEIEGIRVAAGTTTGSLTGGLAYKDDSLYLSVESVPAKVRDMLLGDLGMVAGSGWVQFDNPSATSPAATTSTSTAVSTSSGQQSVDQLRQYAMAQAADQSEYLRKLFSLYANERSLSVKNVEETTIRRTPVYHYTIGSDDLASVVEKYVRYIEGRPAQTHLFSDVVTLQHIYTPMLDDTESDDTATSTEHTIELWVTKDTNTVLKHAIRARKGDMSAAVVTELGVSDTVSAPSDFVNATDIASTSSSATGTSTSTQ